MEKGTVLTAFLPYVENMTVFTALLFLCVENRTVDTAFSSPYVETETAITFTDILRRYGSFKVVYHL